ncbi:hypothetical protein Aph02nite_00170 [Actinoplanes philippinensis]|uniref:PASTA domain-containing protein n=1 Tax=Actinoplanes philippinensis TaxID=35752 RepID=A0A1I2HKC4_9ACTN|nr:hypothetical protein [Actinoplanes philippinensis]GIE74067.1 hypothetical protein Aph02nite_00170 [Actinoplanes philippinensis]SFF30132.1 hypothetical protein SAMN05421541_108277 [Actinoplanes philippinensis]
MRKTSMTTIGLAMLVLSLGACGAEPDTTEPQVAAIPGAATSAAPGATGANNAAVRQLPLGATMEEIDRAYDAYYACWTRNGVPSKPMPNGSPGGPLLSYKMDPKKYQPAVDACADQEPLNAPELDPQQNANFADDLREEKACIESHGIKMEIRGTGDDASLWAVDTKANIAKANSDEGMEFQRQCEISAFTQK